MKCSLHLFSASPGADKSGKHRRDFVFWPEKKSQWSSWKTFLLSVSFFCCRSRENFHSWRGSSTSISTTNFAERESKLKQNFSIIPKERPRQMTIALSAIYLVFLVSLDVVARRTEPLFQLLTRVIENEVHPLLPEANHNIHKFM